MKNITYRDGRFWKNDAPMFLVASDYMYFRDSRENWADRLQKIKATGVNTITSYLAWRHHLRIDNEQRWYDFTGKSKDSRDLVQYLKLVKASGMYLIIKPGPFIHSELNIGGLPDIASPSFNAEMPASRRHHGQPARWSYDNSILPAAFDENFDALVREWFDAIRPIIEPYAGDDGPLIALQFNDETVYCTSNDPPWHIGYEPSGMHFYHGLLRERYGDIANYNRLHATSFATFDFVPGPKLEDPASAKDTKDGAVGPKSPAEVLKYVDWAEYQWRFRRDLYIRYADRLGIKLPYLTNYAGITPPIQENVPDLKDEAHEHIPEDYAPQYPEWWFAMNRVDHDLDYCHYGMISWLGVAAYDRDVFTRYINTSRRARGINMEENWGFGTLYDHRSRYPLVPFFQTLASIAGGATGYVLFVLAGTAYWDETLDKTTKIQAPAFPSHAPIDHHGNLTPMYDTAGMLNRWFLEHGEAFLRCELEVDVAYLLYAPYAGVSSWIPDARFWGLKDHDIPRCGREGFEEFSRSLQQSGHSFAMFELDAATPEQMKKPRALAIQSALFMDADSQQRLADFIQAGGSLFISGELPTVDLKLEPCTILKQAVEKAVKDGSKKVVYQRENLFADGRFSEHVASAGLKPNVTQSDDLRAIVYRGEKDHFVFFFNFDVSGSHKKQIDFYGQRLELEVGSKTSGVLRIKDGKIVGHLVKGNNEVEQISAHVRIQLGQQVIAGDGDFSSTG